MDLKSGLPFSLIKNGLVENYPKLEKNLKTEVVVMGGGISGALTAHYLLAQNIPCIVVDARTIGLGSTCASTSLLQYEIDTPLHKLTEQIGLKNAERSYWLCNEAVQGLVDLAEEIGFTGIQKKESLYYAAYKKDVPKLKKEFTARKQCGLQVNYLDESFLHARNGIKAPGAILSATAAQTDGYLFTHALHQFNISRGLAVYDRTMITKIEHKPRSVELHTENGYRLKAKKLVYATGYETVKYIDKPIVQLLSTYAFASEILSTELPVDIKDKLIWNTASPYLYMRSTIDNRMIIGGRDETFYSPKKRDLLISSKTKKLCSDFKKIFPAIEILPEFSWTGTFGSTSDGLPFIGTYQKLPNSYFALGFGGNGITFSFIAAKMIANLVTGKKEKDTHLFSFDRV